MLLVLFKDREHSVSPRFRLFLSGFYQGEKMRVGSRFSCVAVEMERLPLDLYVEFGRRQI